MKSRYFLIASILASLIVSDVSFAKTRSSKRSGSSQKNTAKKGSSKRAASTNSRRAASTNSRRAASTNSRRAAATGRNTARAAAVAAMGRASTVNTTVQNTTSSGNYCPVGQLVRKVIDDNGNEQYFKSKKNACDIPENAQEVAWNMKDPTKLKQYTLKKGWIEESEAVSFQCEDGNLLYKNACKPFDDFCPLNEIVEKREKDYINPYTDEPCTPVTGAVIKKLTADENDSDIKTGLAYRFSCADNYYADTTNYIQCLRCPSDKPYSVKGKNNGLASCKVGVGENSCEDGYWMGNGETSCQLYTFYNFTEVSTSNSGTLGAGLYDVSASDASCKDGVKKAPFVLTKDTKFSKVSDATGSYFAVGGEIIKECSGNSSFTLKKADGSEGVK